MASPRSVSPDRLVLLQKLSLQFATGVDNTLSLAMQTAPKFTFVPDGKSAIVAPPELSEWIWAPVIVSKSLPLVGDASPD